MRVWPVALGVIAVLGAAVPTSRSVAEQVVADRASGCRIRDQYPDARKTIRWAGQCRNGFAHGGGMLEWAYNGRPDGWVEGTFADGRLEGEARVEWEDGREFTGTFRNGRASGYGVFVWPDGRRYAGEWEDDRRTGFGTLTFPDGHRYVGNFIRNRPTGEGEFITAMGTRYAARVEPNGDIRPGPILSPDERAQPPQSKPQTRKPREAKPGESKSPQTAERPSQPESLDEWLREPTPAPNR
ncbi:MORN repeat-containing protein [Azospirillum soli]|uniref:MORN repeat-containing protein n=1 Tax=Azospirillum soli TaxID=1304799 RepID=UPI001AE24B61|nr:hypothetical protein [Azospirillum soli]MBP2315061.1 hypothetical protein [Azospirillum soli]